MDEFDDDEPLVFDTVLVPDGKGGWMPEPPMTKEEYAAWEKRIGFTEASPSL